MSARKAHVIRIKKDGDDTKWVDVLRLERFPAQQNAGGQGETFHIKWKDEDGDGPGDSANAARTMEDVEARQSDGTLIATLPAIKKMATHNSDQGAFYHFNNDPDANQSRKVKRVKVHPVNVGSLDPTTPVDWDDYKAALVAGSVDTSASINTAIPLAWATKQQQGATYQGKLHTLKPNKTLIDDLNNIDETDDTDNQVWLDPLQVIVNFKGTEDGIGYYGVAFVIGPGFGGVPGGVQIFTGVFPINNVDPRYGGYAWTQVDDGPTVYGLDFGPVTISGTGTPDTYALPAGYGILDGPHVTYLGSFVWEITWTLVNGGGGTMLFGPFTRDVSGVQVYYPTTAITADAMDYTVPSGGVGGYAWFEVTANTLPPGGITNKNPTGV